MVANSDALQKETKPEVKAMTAAVVRKIGQYKNTENQVAYSVLFFPAIALIAATLNFGSVAFARQALRDIAEARTLTTIFSPALGNIFVSSAIYILGVSLLCVVATPVSWFVVWALIVYGQNVSWLLALALSIPSALIALFFTATWIKTLAIVITLHGAAVIVISFAAVLIFPFRQAARWGLLEVLDRAVSSEKGPFMFFATCFALVAALAVQLAKLFGGILPL
jgi:hypothetical protein